MTVARTLAAIRRALLEDPAVYIDQLARVLLALDYDGTEALNPRYWQQ